MLVTGTQSNWFVLAVMIDVFTSLVNIHTHSIVGFSFTIAVRIHNKHCIIYIPQHLRYVSDLQYSVKNLILALTHTKIY